MEAVLSLEVFSVLSDGDDGLAAALVFVVAVVFSLVVFAAVTLPEEAFVVTAGWTFSLEDFAEAD